MQRILLTCYIVVAIIATTWGFTCTAVRTPRVPTALVLAPTMAPSTTPPPPLPTSDVQLPDDNLKPKANDKKKKKSKVLHVAKTVVKKAWGLLKYVRKIGSWLKLLKRIRV
ncbi:hypothetical protein RND81_04G234600 [Saponaria officinalis]|uniref:Uncharacterized protein n=1 Tax=Saponaria officinalis TaxID=3572 RepID=A0AAW1LQK7_SAPOF